MITGIFQSKGGVGKTTTSIVLAELLPDVLLIDASQDSNLTAFFQVPTGIRKNNIYSLLFEKKKPEDCIYKSNGKAIIPASIKTADDSKFKGIDLSKKLNALPYSNIIIDTQPNFGAFNRACIAFSDVIIMPVNNLWAAESALILNNNIKQIKKDVKVYILPTMIKRNKITREIFKFTSDKGVNILPGIRYNSKAENISFHGKLDNNKLIKDYKKAMEGII